MKRFLHWMQNSVFEGELTDAQIETVKNNLNKIINVEADSVLIYIAREAKWLKREYIGQKKTTTQGGCYYLTASGNKKYVDKSFCSEVKDQPVEPETTKPKESEKKPAEKKDSSGREYIKGSRGGCYYMSESGEKVYVKDKRLCDN